MRLALTFAITAATVAPVAAEPVAVAAVDVEGLPEYLPAIALGRIEQALSAAGDVVVTDARARLPADLVACREGACIRRVATSLAVELVVFVAIVKPDEHSTITLHVRDGRSGDPLAQVVQVCELCGDAELLERLELAVSTVRAKAAEELSRRKEAAEVAKRPPPPPPASAKPGLVRVRGSMVPGIAVTATGAVIAVAGIAALVLDGRGTCSPGDTPVYPDPGAVIRYPDPADHTRYVCREVYETKTLGLITTGVGVAAIATGVALVVRARTGHMIEIAPVPAGATAKVTWRW